jgi:hypothetical protein
MRAIHKEYACVFMTDVVFPPNWRKHSAAPGVRIQNHVEPVESAFKELDPIPAFRATAKLGRFLEAASPA